MLNRSNAIRRLATTAAAALVFASATAAYAQQRTYQLDIPAQDLGSALKALASATGQQVVFKEPTVRGKRSVALKGNYSLDEAVGILTGGAGVTASRSPRGVIVVSLLSCSTGGVCAEDADQSARTATAQSDAEAAGEIVVTAQRRAESIMDVPLAITALGQNTIEQRGLIRADDYLRTIPSVIYRNEGPGLNTISIRGAYGDVFRTGPTVGVYFGDIPLAGLALGGSADIRLIDVARVEVLRGPQGTLYGSNSLSGTVRNIPNRPDIGKFEGNIRVGYSSTSHYGSGNSEIQGVINVPIISDLLAIRAVGYHFDNSAFIRNVASRDAAFQAAATQYGAGYLIGDRDVGANRTTGARISALLTPTEALSLEFNYIYQKDSADSMPFALRSLGKYRQADYDWGPFIGVRNGLATDLQIKNLTATYRTDWGTFVSSSSIIDQDFTRSWTIGAFFPVNGLKSPIDQLSVSKAHQFTQEVRFASDFEGPFQIVAGVFYDKSRQPSSQIAFYEGTIAASNPFAGGTLVNRGPTPPPAGAVYGADIDRRLRQVASYGEISFNVTEKLKITGGMRYFDYRSHFITGANIFSTNTAKVAAPATFFDKTASENGTTFKVAAEYSPTKHAMVYAKFSQGFRLGRPKDTTTAQISCDLNNDGTIDGTQLSATDPLIKSDQINSYELGGKLGFLGGRGNIRAAAYRNDWKNIPITIRPAVCPLVSIAFNGGEARAEGVELEGDMRFGKLAFDFGVGYVNSKLTNTTSIGAKGARINFAPEWNGHIGAEYSVDVGSNRSYLRGDYTYFDKYWIGVGQTGTKVDSYGTVNTSAGIDFGAYDLQLFADNVFNSYGITTVDGDAFVTGAVFPSRPRTIGVRLGAKF